MLKLSGDPTLTCEGLTRREWLEVGGLSLFGLTLPGWFERDCQGGESSSLQSGFGRAKSCLILFLFGAPAHQDTWDLKPQAPAEIRGEFSPIATRTPGLAISEHLPMLATISPHYAVVRSVTHADNTHTVAMHYMLTGERHRQPNTNPRNAPDDFPCFGAMLHYLEAQGRWSRSRVRTAAAQGSSQWLPTSVSLNAPANQVSANNHIFPGFFAGLLGNQYDPLFIEKHPNESAFQPFATQESPARLIARQELTAVLQNKTRQLDHLAAAGGLSDSYNRALGLLTSSATREAFAIEREPVPLRERYGMTPFGQGCLLGRRLIEAGVPLVTVNWQRDDAYWDTHANNFVDLKTKLLPNFDRAFSALLEDLASRGLLDDTLVVCLGEFGRTPHINSAAGRDHWGPCNSVVLAGAGIGGGRIYGSSDRQAAYPQSDPVTPEDLAATIYHLLGIDPHGRVHDRAGRPLHISTGKPLSALWS